MPADRRALRQALSQQRAAPAARFVGFDFDCTLTVRHFFKVFAWCYAQRSSAHPHCKAFYDWCRERDVEHEIQELLDPSDPMSSALEDFCRHAGEKVFHEVFREVFLGGDERITMVASWLESMRQKGVEFGIVTAGTSTAVLRALSAAPEWQPFFPSVRIWDTQQGRHSIRSLAGHKVLMLRDICPTACRIVLVDDSIERDRPPQWVLDAAQVSLVDLPYEGPGVDQALLDKIAEAVLA
mmetsp:Transcript_46153/g.83175  ORF Transcript_46153/g.83175 Transcript_46153/m.83175 type:complete len:239 (+) Transcript_46153:112-828(+)